MDILKKTKKNKYLSFASTDNNKEVLKKYIKLWDETLDKFDEYGKLNITFKQ